MQEQDDDASEAFQPEIGYQPAGNFIWSDITGLIPVLHACFERMTTVHRRKQIEEILLSKVWVEHYRNKVNGRRVLSESGYIEHSHELMTSILFAKANYDVVFAPKAMFVREAKRFDVFLLRDTIILKADLKNITSKNPDTIANRIKSGADQASRVVVHINSDIGQKELIDGLQSGVERNKLIQEILLFYKQKLYRLPKNLILSRKIFDVL